VIRATAVFGEIRQNEIRACPPDRRQALHHGPLLIDPAIRAAAMIIEYSPLT
jgi:hypothetical protein